MISRRRFLYGASTSLLSLLLACEKKQTKSFPPVTTETWTMPDEGEKHLRTWMAFGASEKIWGVKLLPEVRKNLALIANTIVQYEPVNMLVRKEEVSIAKSLLDSSVQIIEIELDDLWLRDTGPIFVKSDKGKKAAIDFNFNGWGGKQDYFKDKEVASFVGEKAMVGMLNTSLVMEGGCVEVDGKGTAILTESCVLNNNRNNNVTKEDFEKALKPLLGLDKVIWLPGIKGKDITDGHTDFYARFASPGVVIAGYEPDTNSYDHAVTNKHLEILKQATDAQEKKLKVLTLEGPLSVRPQFDSKSFAAGYVGFYVCNDAVILQGFGDDKADKVAKETLQEAFPKRKIEQIAVDGIAAGGGSIHCTTQQEPA